MKYTHIPNHKNIYYKNIFISTKNNHIQTIQTRQKNINAANIKKKPIQTEFEKTIKTTLSPNHPPYSMFRSRLNGMKRTRLHKSERYQRRAAQWANNKLRSLNQHRIRNQSALGHQINAPLPFTCPRIYLFLCIRDSKLSRLCFCCVRF